VAIKENSVACILDPTVRFEVDQAERVDAEKKKNYEKSVKYFEEKYWE
jgi:hypothetical protein